MSLALSFCPIPCEGTSAQGAIMVFKQHNCNKAPDSRTADPQRI